MPALIISHAHYALIDLPNQWWVWFVLLLFTDLIWYWYHRFSHEVNILWAAHIVHHHSEDFNYTVSGRITVFQALIRNIFWCFLPLIGFPPYMVITILIVHGAYSFFTHTRIIGKLGFWKTFLLPHRIIVYIMLPMRNTSTKTMATFLSFGINCSAHLPKRKKHRLMDLRIR